jgi:hypothetical protein
VGMASAKSAEENHDPLRESHLVSLSPAPGSVLQVQDSFSFSVCFAHDAWNNHIICVTRCTNTCSGPCPFSMHSLQGMQGIDESPLRNLCGPRVPTWPGIRGPLPFCTLVAPSHHRPPLFRSSSPNPPLRRLRQGRRYSSTASSSTAMALSDSSPRRMLAWPRATAPGQFCTHSSSPGEPCLKGGSSTQWCVSLP